MNTKQEQLLQLLKEIDSFCEEHNITYYCAAGTVLGAIRHDGFIPWDDDIDILMTRDEFLRFVCAFKDDGPANRSVEYFGGDHEHHSTVARYVKEDSTLFCHYHITGYAPAGVSIDIFVLDPVPDDHDELIRHISRFYAYSDLVMPTLSHSNRLPPLYSHVIDEYRDDAAHRSDYAVADELAESLFSLDEASCSNYMLRWGSQPFIYPKEFFGKPEHMAFEDMVIPVPAKWPQYLTTHYGLSWTDIPHHGHRNQHNTIFDPERDYRELYSVRDSMYDQPQLYDLHRSMQLARCRSDALYHTLEDYAASLQIRICESEIRHNYEKAGLPYEPLAVARELNASKSYEALTALYEPYIRLQTRKDIMGTCKHGGFYHILFPIVIPTEPELLKLLLRAMLYSGHLQDALNITGIYCRAGLADENIQEINDLLNQISTIYGLYYSGDYSSALERIHRIENYRDIPQLRDYEWLSLVHTGMDKSQEKLLYNLSEQNDATAELKKAYGDLLFAHDDISGACVIYTSLLQDSRNGMFLKDILDKGFEFDADIWALPEADEVPANAMIICLLSEELTGLCRKHDIELIERSSEDHSEEELFMTAASACRFIETVGRSLPSGRKLLSWKSGDAVKAFDILYADTSSVECDLLHDSDPSCCYAAVRIHIIRRASLDKLLKGREKLVKIMDLSPYTAGRQASKFRTMLYQHLAGLADPIKRMGRKTVFKALMAKELQADGIPSEKDFYRTLKNSYAKKTLSPSVLALSSSAVSCDELFTVSNKALYKSLPWFDYGRASKELSKLDKKVKDVWQKMLSTV